ncbi:hypothetical protein B0T19DRAFT_445355 [Cercophora scortea]|uniref:Rhodopsin domain-containing protein n=1 Tax=Cercophora scortea TaxID=314031 RepID=A0AAE0M5A9_9PEZI|nr:hypothetical protein B0T19DRAFT_445355 [Cercophora scortea]
MTAKERGTEFVIIIWSATFAALVAVMMRLLARVRARSLGWDDIFTLFSLAPLVACTSIFTYDVRLGMGRHSADLAANELRKAMKFNLVACPFGVMAYSFPNAAIALQMDRVLAPNYLRSISLRLLATTQCLVAAVSCILLFTQCLPTEHLWNPTTPATCLPAGVLADYCYFVGVFSAFTDIVLAIAPISPLLRLKLPTKTRLRLCILMGGNLFAAVCSVIKTSKFNEMANVQDYTYDTVDLTIWVIVEASVIIIAASAPSIWPLLFPSARTKAGEHRRRFPMTPTTPFTKQFGSTRSLVSSARIPACILTGNADLELDELEGEVISMAITYDFMLEGSQIRALPPTYPGV